jgi:hypothetical protein
MLQAADILAIDSHVEEVCHALAARLFSVNQTHHHVNSVLLATKVLLHALVTLLDPTFSHVLQK